MSTSTTNYGFLKPDPSENVNVISQLNDNLDDIDTELAKVSFHPVARMTQNAGQSIPNIAWTAVTFDTEEFDTHNGHSTSANTSRFTCPANWGGYYRVSGSICYAANATGVRLTRFAKNGTAVPNTLVELTTTGGGALYGHSAGDIIVALSPGDYVELHTFQNSGGALSTAGAAGENGSSVSVSWDRPL